MLRDVSSRIEIEREMEEVSARLLAISRTDELTGFQNRRGLAGRRDEVAPDRRQPVEPTSTRSSSTSGNVKELNDTLGHQAGDAALQAVARALAVAFRKVDVLARIGGTTFLALAPNLGETERDVVTGRILEHLAAPGTTEFVGAPIERVLRVDHPSGRGPLSRSRSWWPAPTGPCSRPATPGGRLSRPTSPASPATPPRLSSPTRRPAVGGPLRRSAPSATLWDPIPD